MRPDAFLLHGYPMGLFDMFRRPAPIKDAGALAHFIDEQSAFVAQKGIYEYARARAAHYSKVLFREPEFQAAANKARWSTYPITLAMVAELVEGVLCRADPKARQARVDAIGILTLAVFDRYPAPPAIGAVAWGQLRDELDRRLNLIGLHPPKWAKDIPEPYWEAYFNLMPIHEKLKAADAPVTRNFLRLAMINAHDELTKRIDLLAVVESLRSSPVALRSAVPAATIGAN